MSDVFESNGTITIGKKEIAIKNCVLSQSELQFYTENPRIYSAVNISGTIPTQDEIQQYMTGLDSVKQLKTSIESNGGVTDPLIVRDGDYTVLEGNSRLAAYRLLAATDPIKWSKVKCQLLPADVEEKTVFTLLGQYHIIGRKDWDPYEQASYLYRRSKATKIPVGAMAEELGLTKGKAAKMIATIEFMHQHNDVNKRHWSHYDEYLKNAGIKKYRETNPDLDDTIAKAIREEKIKNAPDLRKLGNIAKVGDRQSKKIMQQVAAGEIDLYEGYSMMEEAGKMDDAVQRLKKFRKYISDDDVKKKIYYAASKEQALFEIKKIIGELSNIQKKLK